MIEVIQNIATGIVVIVLAVVAIETVSFLIGYGFKTGQMRAAQVQIKARKARHEHSKDQSSSK